MSIDLGRAKELFLAALDVPAHERATYLDSACAGDTALRQRIEAMLKSHETSGELLPRAPGEMLAEDATKADATAAFAPQSEPLRTLAEGELPEDAELSFLSPSSKPGSVGRLGHYEVLEVLGKGGFGIVLKGFDERLHRMVAIKVLSPAFAANGSARKRFIREARAAAAVKNEQVVAIYDVQAEAQPPYLVMELIDGVSLQDKIDKHGPLGVKEILRIGMQIAEGLAVAHKQGLVHRDIKPANILLENGVERVKITDFGLARAVDDASVSQSGTVAGTPMYMSPEQAEGLPIDHRSDLFSLGTVLYAMCTGHPPFRASGTHAVLKRVIDASPRPMREINNEIPDWLCSIVAKLHAKKPEERFATAKEVAELLGQHLAHVQQPNSVAAPPALEVKPTAEAEGRSAGVVRLALTLALVGFGIQVVLVGHWLTRGRLFPLAVGSVLVGLSVALIVAAVSVWRRGRIARMPAPLSPPGDANTGASFSLNQLPLAAWIGCALWVSVLVMGLLELQHAVLPLVARGLGTLLAGVTVLYTAIYLGLVYWRGRRTTAEPRPYRIALFLGIPTLCTVLFLFAWVQQPLECVRNFVLGHPVSASVFIEAHDPDLVVTLDNNLLPVTPLGGSMPSGEGFLFGAVGQGVPPGPHRVQALKNGVVVYDESFTLVAGEVFHIKLPRPKPDPGEGWVQLFNCKDLNDWQTHPDQPGEWQVKDGILIGSGKKSHLFKKLDFDRFHLRLVARVNDRGTGGVQFRVPGVALQDGLILAGSRVEINSTNDFPMKTGALWNLDEPKNISYFTHPPPPPGEWFTLEILSDGGQTEIRVNDKKSFAVDTAKRPAGRYLALSCTGPEGTILQFKKIEIKELPPTPAPSDKERLQGLWVAESGERDGAPIPTEMVGEMRVHFDGDKIRVAGSGGKEDEGTFMLDPAMQPRQINVAGSADQKARFGIYRFQGDRLEICMGESKERPTEFQSKKGDATRIWVVLRQVWPTNEQGWVQLFNGKNFDGWNKPKNDVWQVKDGLLVIDAASQFSDVLFSQQDDYENFHLRFEAKVNANARSSVLFHLFDSDDFERKGYGLTSVGGGQWVFGGFRAKHGVISYANPPRNVPQDKWFVGEIIVNGPHAFIVIDGKRYAEVNGLTIRSGHIGLQAEKGSVVHFKKIEIKKLPPEQLGWVQLFNGKDLTGWTFDNWGPASRTIKDGILVLKGMHKLHSKRDDFANFHLCMEVKLNRDGQVAQYFRGKMDPKIAHLGRGYEAEIVMGERSELKVILADKTTGGFVRLQPDTWFTQEVIAEGNRIILKVDGKVVGDFVDPDRAYMKGGLIIRGLKEQSEMEIRKIEIKELSLPSQQPKNDPLLQEELDRLKGEWVLSKDVERLEIRFAEEEFELRQPRTSQRQVGRYQVEVAKKELLLHFKDQTVPVRCSYRLEGDRLRLIFAGLLDKDAHPRGTEDFLHLGERTQSRNNLAQLALAMNHYVVTRGALPPAALTNVKLKDGKPLLSWRVALLPFLEQDALFKEFKLDEPWDSPHNKKLIARMPKIFATPGINTKEPGLTHYRTFVGRGTAFEFRPDRHRGVELLEIEDGLANTLLIVEASEPVCWTKPDDLPYDPKIALPKLGVYEAGIHVALCDGSVGVLSPDISEKSLRALITRNGSETASAPFLKPEPPQGPPLFLEFHRRGSFQPLFNGKDIEGWQGDKTTWKWKDGTLVGDTRITAGAGFAECFLFQPRTYRDFELKFKVQVKNLWGGISCGVGFRGRVVTFKEETSVGRGPEIAIGKNLGGLYTRGGIGGSFKPPKSKEEVEEGLKARFNDFHIKCVGKRVTIKVNGVTTIDDEFADIPEEGIFYFHVIRFVEAAHWQEVTFKDVQVRDLSEALREEIPAPRLEADFQPLFNGKDLTGWRVFLDPQAKVADPAYHWVVKNGLLWCRGQEKGYLISQKDYENYVLTLKWRYGIDLDKSSAASGVYLHVTGPDKIWPKGCLVQLRSGRAGDLYLVDGFKMAFDPKRIDPKLERHCLRMQSADNVENPFSEWNTCVITCHGDKVRIEINGQLVNEAERAEISRGKIMLKSEGAAIHFKDIMIKELPPTK